MTDTHKLVGWLDIIDRQGVNLSTWEMEFIEKMMDKVSRFGDKVIFSDNEGNKIEEIYTERVR